jgi:hypothetical protein
VSCWAFSGHSSFFAEARRKDENERPQTIQRQQISKMVSPTTSSARSDARVQHVDLQFGTGSRMHFQFAFCSVRMFDQEKSNSAGYMLARHIKPKKIVFHSRLLLHETCRMNQMQQSREDSQIFATKDGNDSSSLRMALHRRINAKT